MQDLNYIFAHGSGNKFVLIDAIEQSVECGTRGDAAADFVREVCARFDSDGLLFVERVDVNCQGETLYAMNMYNTDGTQAEMCGNGMRIVARYVYEHYLDSATDKFTLYSGGGLYPITVSEEGYGVEIAIRKNSADFTLSSTEFVDKVIAELHPSLKFTYLNLGNPHIVAVVDSCKEVDLELLSELGERVKTLKNIFPNGINVSFLSKSERERNTIFVATYERGVGLTPSCGTAMTASSTVAAILGICDWDSLIRVENRGGFVHTICHNNCGELRTELIGNAVYIEEGQFKACIDHKDKKQRNK